MNTFAARGLVHTNSGSPGKWWGAVRWQCGRCGTRGTRRVLGPTRFWRTAAEAADECAKSMHNDWYCSFCDDQESES